MTSLSQVCSPGRMLKTVLPSDPGPSPANCSLGTAPLDLKHQPFDDHAMYPIGVFGEDALTDEPGKVGVWCHTAVRVRTGLAVATRRVVVPRSLGPRGGRTTLYWFRRRWSRP